MSTYLKFILVDDNDFTNMLHDMVIKDTLGEEVNIEIFERPEEGLEFIQKNYAESSDHTILFLDINMPKINGWEFLVRFEEFSEAIKKQIDIYIVSSSLDRRDWDKAENNKSVRGFISKPLTAEVIISIANNEY